MTHGTSTAYKQGCRCEECRRAKREYTRDYRAGFRKGRPSRVPQHGTTNEYHNYGCRCVACCAANTAAHTAYRRRKGVPTRAEVDARRRAERQPHHGTESEYCRGCRCDECRAASATARRERRRKAKTR